MTRDQLKRRLAELGVWDLFAFKLETRALPGMLESNEIIRAATTGVWEARRWVVLATDRRWLFFRSQVAVGGERFEKLPEEIIGCESRRGWIFARFTLRTSDGEMIFRNVPKRTVDAITRAAG